MITKDLIIIFIDLLAVCLIGFKKYFWFISIGYGFSISIVGIMLLILFRNNLELGYIIGSIILILYGFRLGGFLAYREIKSTSYNKKMKNEISDGSHMTIPLKIMLWIRIII